MEQSVYGLLRTRDMAIARYKEFGLPTQWLLDSGVVGKVNSEPHSMNTVVSFKLMTILIFANTGVILSLPCMMKVVVEFLSSNCTLV